MQEELKQKEHRWMASTSRLRDRLDYIERENAELKEEIKLLEKKRLEAWQQKDTLLPVKNDKVTHSLTHTYAYMDTHMLTCTSVFGKLIVCF